MGLERGKPGTVNVVCHPQGGEQHRVRRSGDGGTGGLPGPILLCPALSAPRGCGSSPSSTSLLRIRERDTQILKLSQCQRLH